jgi:hypothetical protein
MLPPECQGIVMPTTTHFDVPRSRDEIGDVVCLNCGKPMKLSCTSAGLEGCDLMIFDCDKCDRSKTFVVHQLIPMES